MGAFGRVPEPLAQIGLVHHADHGLAVLDEPDQRAPDRDAEDEGPSAVDGIERPAIGALGGLVGEFFAGDAVLGIVRLDQPAHRHLGAAVRLGDGIEPARGLVDDIAACAEMRTDDVAGGVGESVRERNEALD